MAQSLLTGFPGFIGARLAALPALAQNYIITGARIETGDGRVIPSGVIVIQDGRITQVATTVPSTFGQWERIDATGLTAYPGFIDAFSSRNLNLPNARSQTPRDQRTEVQAHHPAVAQTLRHVASHDALRHVQHLEEAGMHAPLGEALHEGDDARQGDYCVEHFEISLASEVGPVAADVRHRATTGITLRFPRRLVISAFGVISSGRPFNITTGRDENRDGLANDRPADVARNTGYGPDLIGLDLRWYREFKLRPSVKEGSPAMTVSVDAFNMINRVNYQHYMGALSSPFFGKPTGSLPPRRVQLGVRLQF